jgi:serine protease Do
MLARLKKTLYILALAAAGGIAGAYWAGSRQSGTVLQHSAADKQPVHFVNSPGAPVTGPDFTTAADLSVHAVVHVKTYTNQALYNPFDPFGFWGQQQRREPVQEGSGSGVIITDDGYIVTNNHVVNDASKVEVTLNDNRTFTAKIVGTDPSTDLALLKIDEKNLPFIVYGNSDDLRVGEWVLAVGNPFNLTSTVTAGIVSAKARNIGILPDQFKIESFIQTDAAVNPGNSGGALVNTRGELVGINAAIASSTGSYAGYSFAIPVNLVKKVMNDLLEYGSVQRGFIGVSIRDIDSKLANEKGIRDIRGVYVAGLTEDGAAADAGIREGDIILKIGDVEVNSSPQLQEQVGRFRPGDRIAVTYSREGEVRTTTLTLRNREGSTALVKNEPAVTLLGAEFQNIPKSEMQRLAIKGGVKVTRLNNGKLSNAGIREGFIITQIDKRPIANLEELDNTLRNKQGGVLIEGVYPNGTKAYYGFGI